MTPDPTAEPKACPFCGSEPYKSGVKQVQFSHCRTAWMSLEDWNRRAPQPETAPAPESAETPTPKGQLLHRMLNAAMFGCPSAEECNKAHEILSDIESKHKEAAAILVEEWNSEHKEAVSARNERDAALARVRVLETETPVGVCSSILAEVTRATLKFPTWPTDPIHAVAVVGEEFGELQKEVLQLVYEPHKSSRDAVRKEAVQLAAMSLRFLISLDRYEYTPQPQHSQNP